MNVKETFIYYLMTCVCVDDAHLPTRHKSKSHCDQFCFCFMRNIELKYTNVVSQNDRKKMKKCRIAYHTPTNSLFTLHTMTNHF